MQYCYEYNSLIAIAILHTTIVIVIIIVKLKLWSMLYMLKKLIQLYANILDTNTWPMVQCQIWHANYAAFQWTTYFLNFLLGLPNESEQKEWTKLLSRGQ